MKKIGVLFAVLFAFSFCGNFSASGLEKESGNVSHESKIASDQKVVYKSDDFGLVFRLPERCSVADELGVEFETNTKYCSRFLRENCEFCGNITDDTEIKLSVELSRDIWHIEGGFEAIITDEKSQGKTADEILKEKVANDIGDYRANVDFGYFNHDIAGENFNAAWIWEDGKTSWMRKIYVKVKGEKALVIYLDCGDENSYDPESQTIIKERVEKPDKYKDDVFYKCFLKSSEKPSEIGVYSVQSGDNLWKLCEHFYGNGWNYTKVMEHNNLKSDLLQIGQELRIPKL